MLTKLNAVRLSGKKKDNKPYLTIIRELIDTMDDATLRKAANQMAQKAYVFDKLRKAMRIAFTTGTQGINYRGSNEQMSTIARRVEKFCHWVERDEALSAKQEYKNMIAEIKEYCKKRFWAPITVRTSVGIIQIQPQRTNDSLEQFFRSWKRIYRKKSGINALEKLMKSMRANTPLVKNLNDPQYMRILLDCKASLEGRFA